MTGKARALRVAGPCVIVIFGATGDLAKRKLIPALYDLEADGSSPTSSPSSGSRARR